MTKILFVGDPHATLDSLEDLANVLKFTWKTALEHKVDAVCFLGDLFHTHATVNVMVMDFWRKAIQDRPKGLKVVILVGNHDMPGRSVTTTSALHQFINNQDVTLVDRPMTLPGMDIEFRPYIHEPAEFEALPQLATFLVCHTTFAGAQYENGFYAKPEESVDQEKLPHKAIVSGHIHKPGQVGKVYYVGSSRWVTESDANQNKSLCVSSFSGDAVEHETIPLLKVIPPILSFDWKEGDKKPKFPKNAKVTVRLFGSNEWISSVTSELQGAKVRQFPTKNSRLGVSLKTGEQKDVGSLFLDYLQKVKLNKEVDRATLTSFIRERL